MTWRDTNPPACDIADTGDPVALVVTPKPRSIGAFDVRRALPAAECRSVGPFVFFDEMGPALLPAGTGLDVAPHPHIGLSTLTWMIDGEIRHRDSLGTDQVIRPGEVNWMTAGKGIVHSERSPDTARGVETRMHGLQVWLALPREREEIDPGFQHVPAADIPRFTVEDADIMLVAGQAWDRRSPVAVYSDTLYADVSLPDGGTLTLPGRSVERAFYILWGTLESEGRCFGASQLVVLKEGATPSVRAHGDCRFALIGGAPLDGDRHLYWNFVSSSRERIDRAKTDWAARRFPAVPGDDGYIPLPGAG